MADAQKILILERSRKKVALFYLSLLALCMENVEADVWTPKQNNQWALIAGLTDGTEEDVPLYKDEPLCYFLVIISFVPSF